MRIKVLFITLLSLVLFSGCHYDGGFLVADWLPKSLSWLRISTYGLMMACGFLTANFLLQKEFHRLGKRLVMADTIIIILVVGGIIGAKIFFVWETSSSWRGISGFFNQLFSLGGLTWYGGLIVSGIALYVYLRRVNESFLRIVDIGTPALAIGYMFGRLGCLFSGDGCYGTRCEYGWPAPFAMSFPNGAADWQGLLMENGWPQDTVVYNTPFFEAAFSLILFIYFYVNRQKEWPLGVKVVTFLILHSLFRFFIEFIRLNPRDVFGISQGQFISLVIIAISIFYLVKQRAEIGKWIRKESPYGAGNK